MSNVLLTHVASLDDVSQCSENQIVFVEETGEVYTHSTRYGSPVMLTIGEDESAADIAMQPVQATNSVLTAKSVSSKSTTASVSSTPSVLSMDEPTVKTVEVDIQPGYIKLKDGSVCNPSKFSSNLGEVEGIFVSPNLVIDLSDVGICEWGLMNVGVKSTKTNDLSIAMQDMDGDYNTKLLKDLGSPIFDDCSNGWYVPSLGELSLIADSYSEVCSSLSLVGAIPVINSFYWSSTSGDNNKSAWALNMSTGKGQLGYRTSKLAVRRVKKYDK